MALLLLEEELPPPWLDDDDEEEELLEPPWPTDEVALVWLEPPVSFPLEEDELDEPPVADGMAFRLDPDASQPETTAQAPNASPRQIYGANCKRCSMAGPFDWLFARGRGSEAPGTSLFTGSQRALGMGRA
ncbi:MAG TPA: hypothetical protein VIV60_13755 [Polyangiaceae bacterium]